MLFKDISKTENYYGNIILKLERVNNSDIISSSILNRFIKFLDVSKNTTKTYISGIKQFLIFLNNNSVKNPVRDDVIAFKKELTAQGKKSATIALYLSSLRKFFTWCEAENIYSNITAGVKTPKQDTGHKRDYFSGKQLKNILTNVDRSNIEGLRNYAVLALMATGGLRTIEITRANIEDIRNIAGTTCLFIQGKGRTDKKEFIKLTPNTEQAINAYLKARGKIKSNSPLFVSHSRRNNGKRLTTRTISGIAKNSMIKAGFDSPRLTAHSFRHSAVTLSLIGGMNLADVQAFARHASINTTMIYNHAINRMASKCEMTIEQAIF